MSERKVGKENAPLNFLRTPLLILRLTVTKKTKGMIV